MRSKSRLTVRTSMVAVALVAVLVAPGVRYSRHWAERRDDMAIHRGLAETFARIAVRPTTPEAFRGDLERMSEGHARREAELRWVLDFDHRAEDIRLNNSPNSRWENEVMTRLIEARRLAATPGLPSK